MKKSLRFLSVLLALALCFTGMAVSAFAEGEGEQEPANTPQNTSECTCFGSACYPGFVNEECPVCSAEGFKPEQCKRFPKDPCICPDHCVDYRCVELRHYRCEYCYAYYWGNEAKVRAACQGQGEPTWLTQCICTDQCTIKLRPNGNGYYIDEGGCWLCWYNKTYGLPSVCRAGGSSSHEEKEFVPDVSGKYRTTPERIKDKLKPADIAQQTLYIDEATNTILNLYDADGNLITATLSSDGHFYIVPDSSGNYVYIPTGK